MVIWDNLDPSCTSKLKFSERTTIIIPRKNINIAIWWNIWYVWCLRWKRRTTPYDGIFGMYGACGGTEEHRHMMEYLVCMVPVVEQKNIAIWWNIWYVWCLWWNRRTSPYDGIFGMYDVYGGREEHRHMIEYLVCMMLTVEEKNNAIWWNIWYVWCLWWNRRTSPYDGIFGMYGACGETEEHRHMMEYLVCMVLVVEQKNIAIWWNIWYIWCLRWNRRARRNCWWTILNIPNWILRWQWRNGRTDNIIE